MRLTKKLFKECERRGVILEHGGDKLLVTPAENTTPELVEKLRAFKLEILVELEVRKRAAAMHTVKQVLMGEFDGCDTATCIRLADIFRSVPRPVMARALKCLNRKKGKLK